MRLLLGLLLLACQLAHAQVNSFPVENRAQGWFKPFLVQSADEHCDAMLEDVQTKFRTSDPLDTLASRFAPKDIAGLEGVFEDDLVVETEESSPEESKKGISYVYRYVETDGQRIFLLFDRPQTCMGACEEFMAVASRNRLSRKLLQMPLSSYGDEISAANGVDGNLLRDGEGKYYAVLYQRNTIQLTRLTSNAQWSLACEIRLRPENLTLNQEPAVALAVTATNSLSDAANRVRGGEGDCGTLHSQYRLAAASRTALDESVYRPWVISDPIVQVQDSFDSTKVLRWSMSGIGTHDSLNVLTSEMSNTAAALEWLYREKFGMDERMAKDLATRITVGAINRGFLFSSKQPFTSEEESIRMAILGNKPLDEVIGHTVPALSPPPNYGYGYYSDDILGTAVRRPDVVRELLKEGANPNAVNAFGKTPLMHATQQNQIESARALLEHGADPNMATFIPNDRCYYALRSSRVTALHYAVRYASPDLIRLLLSYGAATYAQANVEWGDGKNVRVPGPYPLDWLTTYASGPESNPNIAEADVESLRDLLRVPDSAELSKKALELTVLAESQYRSKEMDAAYRSLRRAIQTGKPTPRTFNNLSLIAYKTEHTDEALEASGWLIRENIDPTSTANAWFNRGLICEELDGKWRQYNGQYYCQEGMLEPFLQSWKLKPTSGARERVQRFFATTRKDTCELKSRDGSSRRFYTAYVYAVGTNRQIQRIYAMHSIKDSIDTGKISWTIRFSDGLRTYAPTVTERIDFKDFSVVVMDAEQGIPGDQLKCGLFASS